MAKGASKASGRVGGSSISQSREIYNELLGQGLNSNIAGIRKKASEGTGNYSFKGAAPVSYEESLNMTRSTMKSLTRGENTLVDGELPNGKHVYYAGKTESPQIQTLLEKRKSKTDTTAKLPDNMNTTTTYDTWLKRNRKRFDEWYSGGKRTGKKLKK